MHATQPLVNPPDDRPGPGAALHLAWLEAVILRRILDRSEQVRDVPFPDPIRLTLSAEDPVRMIEDYAEEL